MGLKDLCYLQRTGSLLGTYVLSVGRFASLLEVILNSYIIEKLQVISQYCAKVMNHSYFLFTFQKEPDYLVYLMFSLCSHFDQFQRKAFVS